MRSSDEHFRTILLSQITEALCLIDPEGIVETWNAEAKRIKGYTGEEIIGGNFTTFFIPEELASGEPARLVAGVREHGHSVTDTFCRRKDGSRFLGRVAIEAIHRPDRRLRSFVSVTQDITQRCIKEEQRAIIVETTPNDILVVDESGQITLPNSRAEQIFDYPSGMMVGKEIEALVPTALTVVYAAMRTVFVDRSSDSAWALGRQVLGVRRDGSKVAQEIALSPVQTPRGRIVIASLVDVSEWPEREEQQQMAEVPQRETIQASNERLEKRSRHLAKARDRAEQANQAKSRSLTGNEGSGLGLAITARLAHEMDGVVGYDDNPGGGSVF